MGKQLDYDISYVREIMDIDLSALLALSKLSALSNYHRDVPVAVWHAARLAGAMDADCGPCSQLMVTMAERDHVAPELLRAVAAADDAALSAEVLLGVRFTRAVLAHSAEADVLRDEIVQRWGRRALLSLAFGIVATRIYPTLKYALGYGRTCTRLQVGGKPLAVSRASVSPDFAMAKA
jgi:hypothetical protein